MKQLILFTGGHHNSTLEVAKEMKKRGFRLVWVGHKFTSRNDKSLSAEYQEIIANGIKFLELKTGKFYRKHFDILEWLKIVFGFFQSIVYLLKYRPGLVFSSGGYLSVPVVITAWFLRIPTITHEQTVTAGWANRAISPFVDKILLTHPSSLNNYPKDKSLVVGLPLREEIFDKKYRKKYSPKLLYITCGKQGSHVINKALFPIIPKLVKNFTIVHQTGANTLTKDAERARRVSEKLGEFKNRYQYAPYFFAEDASSFLQNSDVIVSRSGAHTSYEIMVLNKKSVLIPIPWVSHNEQYLNAKLVCDQTPSVVLEEKDLNEDTLYQAILEVSKKSLTKSSIKLPIDATKKVADIIQSYLSK